MNKNSGELGELLKAIKLILEDEGTKILRNNVQLPDRNLSILASYSGENWQDLNTEEFSLIVSDRTIDKCIEIFTVFFRAFMDDMSGLIGVNSVILGTSMNKRMSVQDFVKNHIVRAAMFLGPEKVSEMLVDWKNHNQLIYTSKYYFQGIDVKSKLFIKELGELLPPDRSNFDTKIIGSDNIVLELGQGMVAVTKDKIDQVFFKPDTLSDSFNTQLIDTRNNLKNFRDCLSLFLNRHITLNSWWLFDKDLKPFFLNNSIFVLETRRKLQSPQILKQSNVDDAQNLMYNFVNMQNEYNRLRVAIQRWMKSIRSNENYEVYSNLRTVLDSIFTNEGETGTSDKLAITSSKYLRTDLNDKIQMYKLIKKFYKCASLIIHGDEYEDRAIELLKKKTANSVQGICSEAIIKILKSGKIPYWDPIALE